ncbi:MAG: methionyl-tRNA formyltransferase [Epulopiscium sp.]|jgi:methionyl-tRNA formyltransferase|nr:methionyl-tRNA formyltransferase [Candidatus Epulonipiscium sp.]
MKVIFMGTPEFAVPSLEKLVQHHEVLAVITQPDKPKGRGKKMQFSPVKEAAIKYGIEVLQPEKIRNEEMIEKIKAYEPDVIAVVAFGQILPEEILNTPKYGCINVHGSLLPQYRGAAPMQWSIINGEKETGITTMYMAKGLDSGDMLLKSVLPITEEDTYGSLYDKMKVLGAELLIETLEGLEKGTLQRIEQEHDKATYAPMITKETGHINWNTTSREIICLIKGLDPAPNAYTIYQDEVLKIWKAEPVSISDSSIANGTIVSIEKRGFVVKTADGGILVTEVQARGGKRMPADAYLRGHHLEIGTILQ